MLGKSRYGLNGDDYDEEDEKRARSDKSSGLHDFHYQTAVVFEYSCVVCVFLFNAAGNGPVPSVCVLRVEIIGVTNPVYC